MKRKHLPILATLVALACCSRGIRPLDAAPLQLEAIDLSTTIHSLLPTDVQDNQHPELYTVKSLSIQVDTAYTGYPEERRPKWLEYRAVSYTRRDTMLYFGDFGFNVPNFVTALDGRLMVVNGTLMQVSDAQSEAFVRFMNQKYGQAVKSTGEFLSFFDVHTWTLGDRLIKYCQIYENDNGALRITMDADKKPVAGGEKQRPHYKGFLFVISRAYAEQVVGKMNTGDLLFCQ